MKTNEYVYYDKKPKIKFYGCSTYRKINLKVKKDTSISEVYITKITTKGIKFYFLGFCYKKTKFQKKENINVDLDKYNSPLFFKNFLLSL